MGVYPVAMAVTELWLWVGPYCISLLRRMPTPTWVFIFKYSSTNHYPSTPVTTTRTPKPAHIPNHHPSDQVVIRKVVSTYEARSGDEVSVAAGDLIVTLGTIREWVLVCTEKGDRGYIPIKFVGNVYFGINRLSLLSILDII